MKENPYAGIAPKRRSSFFSAFEELRRWKNNKDKRERRLRIAIFASLFILCLVLIAVVAFYSRSVG